MKHIEVETDYAEAVDYLLSLPKHRQEIVTRLLEEFSKLGPEQQRLVLERAEELKREGAAADVYAPDRTIPDSYQTERPSEAAEAIYFALNMLDTLQLPVYGIAESPSAQLFTIVRMTEAVGWEEGYSMALGKERT